MSFLLRKGPLFSLCFWGFFPGNRRMEKECPKPDIHIFSFGLLLMKNARRLWICEVFFFLKKKHCTPTHMKPIDAPQPHVAQIPSVYNHFACEMVLAAQEFYAIEKSRWHGQQEDRDHAGLAAVDDEAVVAEAALGWRDGAAQRWVTMRRGGSFVSCFLLLSSHISPIVRDLCVCSVGPMIESGACSCRRITGQSVGCSRAVLFSRQCSRT